MLAKNGTIIESTSKSDENNIEVLTTELRGITITSVYKPPPTPFLMPEIPSSGKPRIVIGDFNSHSSQWGYAGNNADGDAVEAWAETNQLYLIHDAKQPKSFNSGRWKAGYNPDTVFVCYSISGLSKKLVLEPLPKTQHRLHWPYSQCCSYPSHSSLPEKIQLWESELAWLPRRS